MSAKSERNSNIELLRVLVMLFIIGGHVVRFGTSTLSSYDTSLWYGGVDYAIGNFIYDICIVAVNVFVLISGYFGIRFNLSKVIRIELQVLFYSLVLLCIGLSVGGVKLLQIPSYLLPTLSSKWWFITTYIVLCLLSPLLNSIVEHASKQQLKVIVSGGFVLFYVWATISYTFNFKQLVPDFGGNIINFVVLYFTGRYIRLYYKKRRSPYIYLSGFILITLAMYATQLCISNILGFSFVSFANDDSLFVFASAVCLFLAFMRMSFNSKAINQIASYALAVYMIHMNNIAMPFIINWFGIKELHGVHIIYASIYIPLIVYLACALVEMVRRLLFCKMETALCEIMCQKLTVLFQR